MGVLGSPRGEVVALHLVEAALDLQEKIEEDMRSNARVEKAKETLV